MLQWLQLVVLVTVQGVVVLQRKERKGTSLGLRLFITYRSFSRGTERRFGMPMSLIMFRKCFSALRGIIL